MQDTQALPETQEPIEQTSNRSSGVVRWLWVWFWRVTLVVSLGYAWYCFYVPKNEIAWAGEYSSAKQQTVQTGKPMILFFTGEWCVPCRIMKRTVWADDEVESIVNKRFTPIMIDVSDPGASVEELERYEVYVTPTTIIADAEGNVIARVQGGMSKPEFLALLEQQQSPSFGP